MCVTSIIYCPYYLENVCNNYNKKECNCFVTIRAIWGRSSHADVWRLFLFSCPEYLQDTIFFCPTDSTYVTHVCAVERMQSWFSWGKNRCNIYTSSQCCLLAKREPVNVQYVSGVTTTGISVQFMGNCCLGSRLCGSSLLSPFTDSPWVNSSSGSPRPGTLLLPEKREGRLSWWDVAGQSGCEKCCWVLLPQLFSGSRRPGYDHGEVLVLEGLGCLVW